MTSNTKQAPQLPQMAVKGRFFAQYWGQKVMKKNIEGLENFYSEPDGFIRSMTIDSPLFLELKPLSKITDEDALVLLPFISKNFSSRYTDDYIKEQIKKEVLDAEKLPAKFYDILRSKGYALPFMEYSVEDLISFGWVRLV